MAGYWDSSLALEERVEDLIGRMTLEEKVAQMVYDAPAIERLGVPAYNWWNEGLHGVGRAGPATVFPQAVGLAAAWNEELLLKVATAISDEARAKHHEFLRRDIHDIYAGLTYWSPNINIFRDPRWGRGQETYGEDPYLAACLGVQFVRGLQGDDQEYLKLVATPKHYAVHSGPESSRHSFDAQVSERDLRETYLPHFEACVKEAKAASIMGAYNRMNGEACCASPKLLQAILRDEWDFDGYVVSDCWAIIDIYAHHKLVKTPPEAAALAVNHGCDLNCGSTFPYLVEAVEAGLIAEEAIDQAVTRLFSARFKLGMFDDADQVPYAKLPYEIVNSPDHQALALQAARESIVLLKNEDELLPLSKDIASIAVIGPNADEYQSLLGNYHGTPVQYSTPLASIREKVSPQTKVSYAQGCALADGLPPLTVIPAAYLHPADGAGGENGLTASYYDNPDFAGEPRIKRVDPVVDNIWLDTTPFGGQGGEHFSVRWSGYLTPPVGGKYRLGGNGFSAFTISLDGEEIASYGDIHHPRIKAREIELEAGWRYEIQVELASRGLDPQIQLLWAVPGIDYEAEALETAVDADVIIAVMGLSPNLEGEEMPVEIAGFSGGDRTAISLPTPQEALLKKLHALGKPLVLVLLNGSALAVGWAEAHVPAIVEAWYPGQAGGAALADILFGDYNPAGRLPVTFYRTIEDLPPFEDYSMNGRTYRYFQGEPLFPFGHGLSYTTFQFANLQLDQTAIEAGAKVNISVEISNTGPRSGDEVIQLYTRQFTAPPRPIKELKGFKRVNLTPGETKTVTFTLYTNQLGVYDQDLLSVVCPGKVEVLVGGSSANLPLSGSFEIVGPAAGISSEKVFFSQVQVAKAGQLS